jgi:acid phosphatase
MSVLPTATTTYVLTANNTAGSVSASVTVTVQNPSVATPTFSLPGGTYTMPQFTTITAAASPILWCYTPTTATTSCVPATTYTGKIYINPATTEALCAATAGGPTVCNTYVRASTPAPAISSSHVVLLIEENHSYAQVTSSMPYLMSLGKQYAHTSDYHADTSGSMMDYLWLSSGSSEKAFGCTGNGCTSAITDDNIFAILDKAGLTWKEYMEGIPSIGYMGTSSGAYVKRHNPAPWYSSVINSAADTKLIVPYTQFAADIAAGNLPNYSVVVPNLNDDAHNGTLAQADTWLSTNLPALLQSKYFQPGGDGVLIITFDECDAASTGICGGATELVYTAVIGPKVKRGYVSPVSYKHENTLKTALTLLGMTSFPGASATAVPMSDMFQ